MLPDSPASPATLPKYVDRISRLVKQDRRKLDQVETRLHQLWVADDGLHPLAELPVIPSLSRLWGNIGGEHRDPDPLIREDAFQSPSDIALLRIHRVDLAPTTTRQFCFHFLHQPALLRVNLVFVQIWRIRYQESFTPLRRLVVLPAEQLS